MEIDDRKFLFTKVQKWKKLGRPYCSKFTLYEYSLQVPLEVKISANKILEQTREVTLTSVYHTTLDKRLVVDGVHRSIGIQMKLNESERIPEARVIECYGKDVVEMFKSDFIHLIN